jgi:hypothetical protein
VGVKIFANRFMIGKLGTRAVIPKLQPPRKAQGDSKLAEIIITLLKAPQLPAFVLTILSSAAASVVFLALARQAGALAGNLGNPIGRGYRDFFA